MMTFFIFLSFKMSVDPSSSSTLRSPIVTKICIDLAEYNKLIDLKHHLDHQEKKLSEQLHRSVQNQQKGEGENTLTEETTKEPNLNISPSQEESSEDKIVTKIIKLLENKYGLVVPSTSQTGAGFIQYCLKHFDVFKFTYTIIIVFN